METAQRSNRGKKVEGMYSRGIILWIVDAQADFMFPGGKLYVSGAEQIIPN